MKAFQEKNKINKFLWLFITLYLFLVNIVIAEDLVEITAEITEINNNKARELGIKWVDTINFGEVSWGAESGERSPEMLPEVPGIFKLGDFARYTAITGQLKMLIKKGAAKIVSKPKLVTESGSQAEFRVGGQFPVVSSGVEGGSIEWKDYGIILKIKPKVLKDRKIRATVLTEVSRLDWANRVGEYPALSSRSSENRVVLKSGETIVIAGLTETKEETTKEGIPILSEIPLLNYLFGSNSKTFVKNTIFIFVTPRIVK